MPRTKNTPMWEAQEIKQSYWDVAKTCENMAYREARRLTNDPHEVDDLVQEAFLSLFSAGRRFDPLMNLKFTTTAFIWVRRHVKNSWDKKFKRGITGRVQDDVQKLFEDTQGRESDHDDSLALIDSGDQDPSQIIEDQEFIDDLPESPEWLRRMATMRFIEGKSDKEIMKELRIKKKKFEEYEQKLIQELELIFGVKATKNPELLDQYAVKRLSSSRWQQIHDLIPESPSYLRLIATRYHREGTPTIQIASELGMNEDKIKTLILKIEEFWKESRIVSTWKHKSNPKPQPVQEEFSDLERANFECLQATRVDQEIPKKLFMRFAHDPDGELREIAEIQYESKDRVKLKSPNPHGGYMNEWEVRLDQIVLSNSVENG